MNCNSSTDAKRYLARKKYPIMPILGVTFHENGGFSSHVENKLIVANKCPHVLRTLKKERYSQKAKYASFNGKAMLNVRACIVYRFMVRRTWSLL